MAEPKEMTMNQRALEKALDIVHNAVTTRSNFLTQMMDPRRDVYDECGLPPWKQVNMDDTYQLMYDREAIGTRVVEVLPKECWQVTPSVFEDDNPEATTPFEEAWDSLGKQLQGEDSWYQDEEGSIVWNYLFRADVLSGIGRYGVILIGLDDGLPLDKPARFVKRPREEQSGDADDNPADLETDDAGDESDSEPEEVDGVQVGNIDEKDGRLVLNRDGMARKVIYLRPLPESMVKIASVEGDKTSPRYGLPLTYNVQFFDPGAEGATVIGEDTSSQTVHWSRIVHIADNLGSSESYGVPRMQPVLNNLQGLQKIVCGSPEMYWKGAFPGLSFETHPELGGDVEIDDDEFRDKVEEYVNGLQRYIVSMGMTAKSLPTQVVDPNAKINAQIEIICILLGMPVRIFKGSERGELASSQDDAAWNDRISHRQERYLTPRVITPFVNRLILLGVLPQPKGFSVSWPDITSKNASEKAAIAEKLVNTLIRFIAGNAQSLMTPLDFFVKVLGMTEDEATTILENAEKEELARLEEEEAGIGDALGTDGEQLDEDGNPIPGTEGEGEGEGEGEEEGEEGEGDGLNLDQLELEEEEEGDADEEEEEGETAPEGEGEVEPVDEDEEGADAEDDEDEEK